jgi:hypothetical protein
MGQYPRGHVRHRFDSIVLGGPRAQTIASVMDGWDCAAVKSDRLFNGRLYVKGGNILCSHLIASCYFSTPPLLSLRDTHFPPPFYLYSRSFSASRSL